MNIWNMQVRAILDKSVHPNRLQEQRAVTWIVREGGEWERRARETIDANHSSREGLAVWAVGFEKIGDGDKALKTKAEMA